MRREVYALERRGIQCKVGKILDIYTKADILRTDIGRTDGQEDARYYNRLNAKRRASEIKANPIVEFHVNEDKGTVTTIYRNGEVEETSYSYTPKDTD